MILPDKPLADFQIPGQNFLLTFPYFPWFRLIGMVGIACLPNNANRPLMPDYTLSFKVPVCLSEDSDLSFVYRFMSFHGLGTLNTDFSSLKVSLEMEYAAVKIPSAFKIH